MSPEQRAELLTAAKERFEGYDPRVWQLRQRIEQLDAADAAEQHSSIVIDRDDARAHPELLVTALEAAGAEVLLVDWDPAEEVEVTIIEDDAPHRDSDWAREFGGAGDGHTVTDPGL